MQLGTDFDHHMKKNIIDIYVQTHTGMKKRKQAILHNKIWQQKPWDGQKTKQKKRYLRNV